MDILKDFLDSVLFNYLLQVINVSESKFQRLIRFAKSRWGHRCWSNLSVSHPASWKHIKNKKQVILIWKLCKRVGSFDYKSKLWIFWGCFRNMIFRVIEFLKLEFISKINWLNCLIYLMRELFPTPLKCVFRVRHSTSLFIFEGFILVSNSLVNIIPLLCSHSV